MSAGAGPTAVVGREAQLSRLDAACRAARSGQGSAICLVGPAGIGKTLLLRTAQHTARRLRLTTAASWCWAEGAPPLWPWLDLLAQLPSAPQGAGELAGAGFAVFRQVEGALTDVAARTPLLLMIDDLHQADEASMLLTRYLAHRVPELPVVLLLAHRPPEPAVEDRESRLLTEIDRACELLPLPPLPIAAIAELAAAHGRAGLPQAAIRALTAASGGIPLHAVAALDACGPGATEQDLTAKIQVSVALRLRRLPADDAAIVARAAVLGQVVSTEAVARVCGTSQARVRAAADAARAADLIRPGPHQEIAFGHDLVREALVGWLDPEDVVDTHAAAVALYEAGSRVGPPDVVRAARHALQAAGRSAADGAVAVELSRRAAAELAAGGAPEDAVLLLEQTLGVNERAGRPVSRTRLLIERAAAVLRAGRLGAANARYEEATEAALAEGDAVALAEAAAGLGALWVNTVRSPVEQRRVLRVQRRALAGLPAGHESLALRLRARIAGEAMFWEGASPDDLLDVLDDVRRLGDSAALLEVLSIAHNPLLGPEHGALRLRLSEEMLAVAADAPGGVLPLMALCWRAVNLFLVGDERAERALADLREPAEALQSLSVLYVVRVIETMLLIRRGRLGEAEAAAQAAFELGTRAEDADALSYFGAHLVTIRWFQCRDAEVLELFERIATSTNLDVVDHSFEAGIAALAARAGQPDLARRHLRRVTGSGLQALPRFSTWLATLVSVIEAAVALQETRTVAEAYELLVPFGDLPVTPSLAVTCFGCVHRWLSTAALAMGRPELAEQHLRSAVDVNLRLGHVPATAVVRAELAGVLAAHHPSPARAAEARELLEAALGAAEQLELETLAGRWRTALARLDRPARLVLTSHGQDWTVDFAGRRAVVRDLAGMRHLALLTATPGHWISAGQLAAGQPLPAGQGRYPVLDPTARRALESRVRELALAVGEARERGDLATQAAVEEELDAVATQLTAATGLGGRDRPFPDEAERARTSVRKAIVRAIDEIGRSHPAAAAHLRDTIVTGASCRYEAQVRP